MRILLANYEYPTVTDNCGGGGEVTRHLRKGLRNRGHDVEVFVDAPDGHHTTFPVRQYGALRDAIDSYQPDVVNAHFSVPTGLTAARPAAKLDVPLVTSVMGADVFDPTRYRTIRPLLSAANWYVFHRSNAVVAPSSDMARRLPMTNAPQSTIGYGIDPRQWTHREKTLSDPPQILTLCRLVERKNLEMAIEAVARYRDRFGPAELTIAGTGPMAEDLRRRRDEQGYHWLSLPGYVDNLQATFDAHDLFFLPSHHEAFGMVFLEALACGLPIVTSPTGGQTDIVTSDIGCYPEPTDQQPQTYATLLHEITDNYREYQSSTADPTYPLDRDAMAASYVDLYQQVKG